MRGRFISLEGGEGSGKSTQIGNLKAFLEAKGITVLTTREPGGSDAADLFRELLLTGDTDRWDAMTEALILYAERRDHVFKKILPALEAGTWVLTDRFADSTKAYQGYAGGLGIETINRLHRLALGDIQPDLTYILDIEPERGIARSMGRLSETEGVPEDRFENMDITFHETLRDGYLKIAANDRARCVVIDADREVSVIAAELQDILVKRFDLSSHVSAESN